MGGEAAVTAFASGVLGAVGTPGNTMRGAGRDVSLMLTGVSSRETTRSSCDASPTRSLICLVLTGAAAILLGVVLALMTGGGPETPFLNNAR